MVFDVEIDDRKYLIEAESVIAILHAIAVAQDKSPNHSFTKISINAKTDFPNGKRISENETRKPFNRTNKPRIH